MLMAISESIPLRISNKQLPSAARLEVLGGGQPQSSTEIIGQFMQMMQQMMGHNNQVEGGLNNLRFSKGIMDGCPGHSPNRTSHSKDIAIMDGCSPSRNSHREVGAPGSAFDSDISAEFSRRAETAGRQETTSIIATPDSKSVAAAAQDILDALSDRKGKNPKAKGKPDASPKAKANAKDIAVIKVTKAKAKAKGKAKGREAIEVPPVIKKGAKGSTGSAHKPSLSVERSRGTVRCRHGPISFGYSFKKLGEAEAMKKANKWFKEALAKMK
jgi:hypothetical protein